MIPQRAIDHGNRRVLTIGILGEKSSIALSRLLLHAIKHYGKPRKIRTGNEAVFTSWGFAFALRWLGIRHERIKPDRTGLVDIQATATDVRHPQRSRVAGDARTATRHLSTSIVRISRSAGIRPSKLGIFRENASQGAEGRRGDDNHPRVDNLIANDRTATVRESAGPNNEKTPEVAKKFATQRCGNAHETHGTHRKLQLSERNSSRKLMLMFSDSGRRTLSLISIFDLF